MINCKVEDVGNQSERLRIDEEEMEAVDIL